MLIEETSYLLLIFKKKLLSFSMKSNNLMVLVQYQNCNKSITWRSCLRWVIEFSHFLLCVTCGYEVVQTGNNFNISVCIVHFCNKGGMSEEILTEIFETLDNLKLFDEDREKGMVLFLLLDNHQSWLNLDFLDISIPSTPIDRPCV